MKSPRFDIRAAPLKRIFSPDNIERTWAKKVRLAMRDQFLNDGIENFDFHISKKVESRKLSQLILEGEYVPSRAQRILVEKSKGLCRQLVIPSVRDAIVLQCLSDALYAEIKNKAPTTKSFYQPQDHSFNSHGKGYGTFASWLNFQKNIFNFSKTRKFIVVTDVANFYDSISYEHLRNVISSTTSAEECVLDMLIYVLADLLWQPDYMPRVEIGLPQINLDAPRLLAHCFLYELDAYLDAKGTGDFVRYMDDIDVGVDSITDAKQVLKAIDLVLQTKQVRLNSGKTQILTSAEARQHFRVTENARLDTLQANVERKLKTGGNVDLQRKLIRRRVREGLATGRFDGGNGEKILKRWIGLAGLTRAQISEDDVRRIVLLRPQVRENVYGYVRRYGLTPSLARALAATVGSGHLVDDAAQVDLANHLVETCVTGRHQREVHIKTIIDCCDDTTYFGFYSKVWLQSKYASTADLLATITHTSGAWAAHEKLGRLVGSLFPIFVGSAEERPYIELISNSRNAGVRDAYKFHLRLRSDLKTFDGIFDALSNPNPSRGTGITHAKFLCLLSALSSTAAPIARRSKLLTNNHAAMGDVYYRGIVRRLGLK